MDKLQEIDPSTIASPSHAVLAKASHFCHKPEPCGVDLQASRRIQYPGNRRMMECVGFDTGVFERSLFNEQRVGTRSRRVARLFLMRFHKHNIAVVGGGSFLRVVGIAHDRDAIDQRRFFPEGLLVILIDVS